MLFNKNLKRLFDILGLPETFFENNAEGVCKQQAAEKLMEEIEQESYNNGYDSAAIEEADKNEEEIEDAKLDAKDDFAISLTHYIENSFEKELKESITYGPRTEFIVNETIQKTKDLLLKEINDNVY